MPFYAQGSSRSRNTGLIVNINQGGGDKKAGLPYQVGRSHWTSTYLDYRSMPLSGWMRYHYPIENITQHRNISSDVRISSSTR